MKRAKLIWRGLGPIKANTALDNVPKKPGVYKLTFHLWGKTYAYIGEAGARGLRARIRDYANSPTQGNKVEHLMHDLLKEAGEAELSVCSFGMDEQKTRRQFEKEGIAKAALQGLICINKPATAATFLCSVSYSKVKRGCLLKTCSAFVQNWQSLMGPLHQTEASTNVTSPLWEIGEIGGRVVALLRFAPGSREAA